MSVYEGSGELVGPAELRVGFQTFERAVHGGELGGRASDGCGPVRAFSVAPTQTQLLVTTFLFFKSKGSGRTILGAVHEGNSIVGSAVQLDVLQQRLHPAVHSCVAQTLRDATQHLFELQIGQGDAGCGVVRPQFLQHFAQILSGNEVLGREILGKVGTAGRNE